MSEEKTEQSATNTDTGSEPKTDNILDRANTLAERLEKANIQAEATAKRMEEAAARIMLSGRASAGQPIKTPEEIQKEKVESQVAELVKKFRR